VQLALMNASNISRPASANQWCRQYKIRLATPCGAG